MGLFSSIAKSILTGESRPMDDYQRRVNFTSACYELSKKEGYEVVYIPNYKPPVRIGKVKCIEELTFVELEVCKAINYRAIIIGNNFKHPSPITRVFQHGIAPYETLKKLCLTDISPFRIDGYGAKLSSAFDFYNYIERGRKSLEELQQGGDASLEAIGTCIRNDGLQWVRSLIRVNDSKLNI